jgi:hypothetical protein
MRQMTLNLVGSLISAALNPQPEVDPAYQQQLLQQQQEALAKKREEERQNRLVLYQQLQEQSARQIKEENQGLSGMLDVVDLYENELQPRGTANYDTSDLSLMDRLRCAAYFSNKASAAAERGDSVNARYLSEQAQKAMLGQTTDEECQFADLPDVPEPLTPQSQEPQGEIAAYESMIESVQQDVKKLQDIEIKLKETEGKIKAAEEKKQQAEQIITQIKSRPAEVEKPEEKQKDDDLLAQAQALLQEAETELHDSNNAKQTLLEQDENIRNRLKEVQESIQGSTVSNEDE